MKTLEQCIEQVLENNDGKCLDNSEERKEVAAALFDMFGDWLERHEAPEPRSYIEILEAHKANAVRHNIR